MSVARTQVSRGNSPLFRFGLKINAALLSVVLHA